MCIKHAVCALNWDISGFRCLMAREEQNALSDLKNELKKQEVSSALEGWCFFGCAGLICFVCRKINQSFSCFWKWEVCFRDLFGKEANKGFFFKKRVINS